MTTLCLCDWVEPQADRDRRLAALGIVAPLAALEAASDQTTAIERLPVLLPASLPAMAPAASTDPRP